MYVPQTNAPLAAALSLALATTPSLAAARESKVTMRTSALEDFAARACMPRTVDKTMGEDNTQPATLCQLVEDRSAHGADFVAG